MESNRKQDCCRACETSGSKPLWHPRQQLVDASTEVALDFDTVLVTWSEQSLQLLPGHPGTEVADMAASLRRYLYQGK